MDSVREPSNDLVSGQCRSGALFSEERRLREQDGGDAGLQQRHGGKTQVGHPLDSGESLIAGDWSPQAPWPFFCLGEEGLDSRKAGPDWGRLTQLLRSVVVSHHVRSGGRWSSHRNGDAFTACCLGDNSRQVREQGTKR